MFTVSSLPLTFTRNKCTASVISVFVVPHLRSSADPHSTPLSQRSHISPRLVIKSIDRTAYANVYTKLSAAADVEYT